MATTPLILPPGAHDLTRAVTSASAGDHIVCTLVPSRGRVYLVGFDVTCGAASQAVTTAVTTIGLVNELTWQVQQESFAGANLEIRPPYALAASSSNGSVSIDVAGTTGVGGTVSLVVYGYEA